MASNILAYLWYEYPYVAGFVSIFPCFKQAWKRTSNPHVAMPTQNMFRRDLRMDDLFLVCLHFGGHVFAPFKPCGKAKNKPFHSPTGGPFYIIPVEGLYSISPQNLGMLRMFGEILALAHVELSSSSWGVHPRLAGFCHGKIPSKWMITRATSMTSEIPM